MPKLRFPVFQVGDVVVFGPRQKPGVISALTNDNKQRMVRIHVGNGVHVVRNVKLVRHALAEVS